MTVRERLSTTAGIPPATEDIKYSSTGLSTSRRRRQPRRNRKQGISRRGLLVLLSFVGFGFLFVNLYFLRNFDSSKGKGVFQLPSVLNDKSLRRGKAWVSLQSQAFNQANYAANAHHLILVAGHSVTISGHLEDAGTDEKDWFLLDYQKGQGLPQAIKAHIKAGIDEANRDEDALLIFSGGETRAVTGPLTEGSSYYHVADAMKMWPEGGTVRARTTTEEFATDSFQNLMYSICRFKEVTGKYPTKITTVSFSFKQRRFKTLHAPALRWPPQQFLYIGVDPPASTGFDLNRASIGESQNAALPFEKDPYGCNTPALKQKRQDRNPFSRTAPYPLSCPEMKELFSYCGPELFPEHELPWDV